MAGFNLSRFFFRKKYGKVDYEGQAPAANGPDRRLAITPLCFAGGREYNPGMKPYAQEAENLRLLFIAGIASVDDVVAWADQKI